MGTSNDLEFIAEKGEYRDLKKLVYMRYFLQHGSKCTTGVFEDPLDTE